MGILFLLLEAASFAKPFQTKAHPSLESLFPILISLSLKILCLPSGIEAIIPVERSPSIALFSSCLLYASNAHVLPFMSLFLISAGFSSSGHEQKITTI